MPDLEMKACNMLYVIIIYEESRLPLYIAVVPIMIKASSLSPQEWLTKKRLEVAYQKLKEGKKVQDVYVETGFKNPSHFSTAFRRGYGIPPREFCLHNKF
ncbi:MAG: AraC family transcriptional regulator [Chitinophagaceae bacterium]|nr:AraC family transcriptional regulator [Chitinophagaceae bacterium]